jgi:hypothetical protein
MPKATLIDSQ